MQHFCTNCKETKEDELFYKLKSGKPYSHCKPCHRDIMRKVKAAEVSRDGVEKVREKRRRERKRNKKPTAPVDYFSIAVPLLSPIPGYALCFMCTSYKRFDQFYEVNGAPKVRLAAKRCGACMKKMRERYIKSRHEHYKANRNTVYERSRRWRKANAEKVRDIQRSWLDKKVNDPESGESYRNKLNEKRRTPERRRHINEKRKNDIHFRLASQLRKRLLMAIKKGTKRGSAVKDLGCSINFLKDYLESQFYDCPRTGAKMTWENHGRTGWHIDHILEFKNVDLNDPDQFKKVVHYTNLRPLWYFENLARNRKS